MPIPQRKQGETPMQFVSRCMADPTMTEEYPLDDQRYAVCFGQIAVKNQETFTDYPQAATDNAKRALKYRDESGNPKGCGTPVGWTRANQLAKREPISMDTVKRMAAFIRHEQNKDVPYDEGCGGLMWDAWGGTEGINWAIRKKEQYEKRKS